MSRETKDLEYKQSITKTFLKTASAYANYGTGTILFGVDDDESPIGLDNPVEEALRIENTLNDAIKPAPRYTISIDEERSTVALTVFEGIDKPYFYNGKAYKRNDSASVEVSHAELRRLALEGSNLTFDELPSRNQALTFSLLGALLTEHLGLSRFDENSLRTLGLTTRDGTFNNAAAILADTNDFKGIDIAVFGKSINEFKLRRTIEGASVLTQYDEAIALIEHECVTEVIGDKERERVEAIPGVAFREAVANALIHRAWDIPANVTVAIHPNRIEIVSPGPIPHDMSIEDYLAGGVSVLRNPLLASVFFRLGYIEHFGSGILRIKHAYEDAPIKPRFEVRPNSVAITLPRIDMTPALSSEERCVLDAIEPAMLLTRVELEELTGYSKSKVSRLLPQLESKGYVVREGTGRAVKYRRS